MPNTLAHLGFHACAVRSVQRTPDLKWVFLGALIPDFPWIARRVVVWLPTAVDPLDLRLYAIAQSTLAASLLLSAALALFSQHPRRMFVILGLNSVIHLTLDAAQTKWGNGVHFFAPFSWFTVNFGLFWPEHWLTYLLTLLGAAYVVMAWRTRREHPSGVKAPRARQLLLAGALLAAYCAIPFVYLDAAEAADVHSVASIRQRCQDCPVAFDRAYIYMTSDSKYVLDTWAERTYAVEGERPATPGLVSVRGVFRGDSTVYVQELHRHRGLSRDIPSYLGLAFVLILWIEALWRERRGKVLSGTPRL